jgi:nucleoredoxin
MDGKVVIDDGVDSVQADPGGLQFPWKPPNLTGLLPSNYLSSDKTSRGSLRDLDHKYIILYFGAAWSPPCQHITPIVSDAFIRLQGCRDDFEMLFVSCDYEQCAFDACWKEMSFGALPFADRETQSRLLSRLRIREIPTLVSLGPIDPATGDRPVINANVRRFFEDGSYADAFPYVPILFGDFNLCRENINTLQAVIVFCEYADDHEHLAVKEAVRNASDQCQWGGLRFYWAVDSTPMTETFREALRIGRGAMGQDPCVVLLDIPDGGSFYVHYAKEVTSDSILGFIASPGERQQL